MKDRLGIIRPLLSELFCIYIYIVSQVSFNYNLMAVIYGAM